MSIFRFFFCFFLFFIKHLFSVLVSHILQTKIFLTKIKINIPRKIDYLHRVLQKEFFFFIYLYIRIYILYIYIYIYIHTHTYIHTYVHIYIQISSLRSLNLK